MTRYFLRTTLCDNTWSPGRGGFPLAHHPSFSSGGSSHFCLLPCDKNFTTSAQILSHHNSPRTLFDINSARWLSCMHFDSSRVLEQCKEFREYNRGIDNLYFVFVTLVPRFLQLYWRGYLEDSRSFNGDPPHLTLNHGFPVIRLSRPKKVA